MALKADDIKHDFVEWEGKIIVCSWCHSRRRTHRKETLKPSNLKTKRMNPFVVADDKKMDIAHFTPHDLRRTCATLISELGFSDATVDAIEARYRRSYRLPARS